MKKRSPERPQTFRASFLFREAVLYKMLSGGAVRAKLSCKKYILEKSGINLLTN